MSDVSENMIPEHLKCASEGLKERLILRENIRKTYEKHQLRYLTISNLQGEELTIDCLSPKPVLIRQATTHIGTSQDQKKYLDDTIEELKKRKDHLQNNYVNKISQLSRRINALIAQEGLYDTLDAYKNKIIELYGKHFTIDEVHATITKQWNHRVNINQLKRWTKQHEQEIETAKEKYLLSNKDFRIAHETGRLDILNQRMVKAIDNDNDDLILKIVDQARKEVKGDQLKLTVDGKIDINATLQGQDNIMAISKKLPINMLIVGLVAAKQGIDPTSIMASLATSYYSKFNGFNGAVDPNAEIPSPVNLIKNYDWDDLERKNKQFNEKRRPITDITEFQNKEEEEKAVSLKQTLLDSLKNA